MADPPPIMRQMNANEERANNDVHVLHLRDDSPEPVHHNNILHSTTDSKLNPMALYPQPEPQLYKSFDWYACNKQGEEPHLIGRNFEGEDVTAAAPIQKVARPKTELESLKLVLGTRYFYKKFIEDRRESGTLKEIGEEGTYLTFLKFKQGYYTEDCCRWDEIQLVWNATGSEEIYNTDNDQRRSKKRILKKAMVTLQKRQGWKEIAREKQYRHTECEATTTDPARKKEYETLTPQRTLKVPLLNTLKKDLYSFDASGKKIG